MCQKKKKKTLQIQITNKISGVLLCEAEYLVLNWASTYFTFLQGHDDRFTVYIHASREQPVHVSRYFAGRNIHSEKVYFPIEISFSKRSSLLPSFVYSWLMHFNFDLVAISAPFPIFAPMFNVKLMQYIWRQL